MEGYDLRKRGQTQAGRPAVKDDADARQSADQGRRGEPWSLSESEAEGQHGADEAEQKQIGRDRLGLNAREHGQARRPQSETCQQLDDRRSEGEAGERTSGYAVS